MIFSSWLLGVHVLTCDTWLCSTFFLHAWEKVKAAAWPSTKIICGSNGPPGRNHGDSPVKQFRHQAALIWHTWQHKDHWQMWSHCFLMLKWKRLFHFPNGKTSQQKSLKSIFSSNLQAVCHFRQQFEQYLSCQTVSWGSKRLAMVHGSHGLSSQ